MKKYIYSFSADEEIIEKVKELLYFYDIHNFSQFIENLLIKWLEEEKYSNSEEIKYKIKSKINSLKEELKKC